MNATLTMPAPATNGTETKKRTRGPNRPKEKTEADKLLDEAIERVKAVRRLKPALVAIESADHAGCMLMQTSLNARVEAIENERKLAAGTV